MKNKRAREKKEKKDMVKQRKLKRTFPEAIDISSSDRIFVEVTSTFQKRPQHSRSGVPRC